MLWGGGKFIGVNQRPNRPRLISDIGETFKGRTGLWNAVTFDAGLLRVRWRVAWCVGEISSMCHEYFAKYIAKYNLEILLIQVLGQSTFRTPLIAP